MKTFLFILFFPLTVMAQTPYKGGTDDGHAFTELKNSVVQSIKDQSILDFNIYPNPVGKDRRIQINYGSKINAELIIYSIEGKFLLTQTVNSNNTINLEGLSAGIYVAYLRSDQLTITRRIIIQ